MSYVLRPKFQDHGDTAGTVYGPVPGAKYLASGRLIGSLCSCVFLGQERLQIVRLMMPSHLLWSVCHGSGQFLGALDVARYLIL